MIAAIITNTIGYRYTVDPDFQKLFLPEDNLPRTYIVTLKLVGNPTIDGKFLNQKQWTILRDTVMRYDEKQPWDMEEMIDIEQAIRWRAHDSDTILDRISKNHESLTIFDVEEFTKRMQDRIDKAFDPDIHQLQSPIQVGCATNLKNRRLSMISSRTWLHPQMLLLPFSVI